MPAEWGATAAEYFAVASRTSPAAALRWQAGSALRTTRHREVNILCFTPSQPVRFIRANITQVGAQDQRKLSRMRTHSDFVHYTKLIKCNDDN